MQNLLPNIKVVTSLGPIVETTTPADGAGVDTAGYEQCLGVVGAGLQAGTSITVKLQESDDNATFTDVAEADIVAPAAVTGTKGTIVLTTSLDKKHHVREYVGAKRYVRWSFSASSSGNIPVDLFFILGRKAHGPCTEEAPGA